MTFAEKMTLEAYNITAEDMDALRTHGLTDAEILDIILVVATRIFWAKIMDAVGGELNVEWMEKTKSLLGENLFKTLMVGRALSKTDETRRE